MKKQAKKVSKAQSVESQSMSRYAKMVILLAIVVVAGLGTLGLSLYLAANQRDAAGLRPNQKAIVTVTGAVACLPHRDAQAPQTGECLYGVKVGNAYYGVRNLSRATTLKPNQLVTVTGILNAPATDERYNVIGVIDVASLSKE